MSSYWQVPSGGYINFPEIVSWSVDNHLRQISTPQGLEYVQGDLTLFIKTFVEGMRLNTAYILTPDELESFQREFDKWRGAINLSKDWDLLTEVQRT